MSPTIGSSWRAARDRFALAGIETASLDARLLAEAAFGCDAVGLAMRENDAADAEAHAHFEGLVARRLAREPVARILGEKAFFGLGFLLSAETLVPRPETELVVELALAALRDKPAPRLLDLGTGTGCIAVALVANLPSASAVATDLSADALATARVNAARHGVAGRIDFRYGDWFSPLGPFERFDVIVSNPPYVPHAEIAGLDLDVRAHDPHLALDGGPDGIDPYRVMARAAQDHLQPGGALIVEHGSGQSQTLMALLARHGFVAPSRHADLAGHDRVVVATRPDRNENGSPDRASG